MSMLESNPPHNRPMIEITEEITTGASPTEAFDFIADPTNHLKFSPALMDVSSVRDGDVGKEGEWTFKVAGVTLEGQFSDTEFDRPNTRHYDLTGDINGSEMWRVEAADGGSKIEYRTETDVPGPDILGTIAEPIAERFMRNDAETKIENLKALLDEQVAAEGHTA